MMNLLTGPLFVVSLLVFVVGMTLRVILYIRGLDWKLERIAYGPQMGRGLPGALTSIFMWLVPGLSRGWRKQPLMALGFFLLHVGAILLPFFLVGHTVLLENATGISLPSFSMEVADALTLAAFAGLGILVVRRLVVKEARALTTCQDWLILILTAVPFISGYLAAREASELWTLVHLISGELFLILAPFTKLSHIVLFFMSRAQIGMDFAIKRGGATRGPVFPW